METQPSEDTNDLVSALGASGFPLQTAVASMIRGLGMYQVEEELAWHHHDGSDRFLDIVAAGEQVRVLIECKKTTQDKFIFLLPADIDLGDQRKELQAIYLHQMQDSTGRGSVQWGIVSALPASYEAMFCVAKSSSSNRLLENDVQPLVGGTEAYALDRYGQFRPQGGQAKNVPCIPVLVTNAPLFVARYKPSDVSLNSGVYKARKEHLVPVKFVRFTKQFTTSKRVDARRRTVVVTQTSAIAKLLTGLASPTIRQPETGIYLAA